MMDNQRLKILFVIKNLQQGGTEGQLLQMLETLDLTLFEYRLCTVSSEVHYAKISGNGRVGSLDINAADSRVPELLASVIDDYRPDLVHSFRDQVNVQLWRALRRTTHQPAVLMSVRGRPIYPQHLALARLMSRRCFKLTVNSVGVASALQRLGRVPADRIEIIHNVSDAERFKVPTEAERSDARSQLGLPRDSFTLLCPARISHVKNQLGLIAALALVKRRKQLPDDFRLLLPGRVRDQLAAWMLRLLIKATGLGRYVCLPGPISDLVPYYHAADALVLPSWAEGMPNVCLEGHLSGLPAIVSRQANRDGIVEDEYTGFVVPTGSLRKLADAIVAMIAIPVSERHAMGWRGRVRVLQRFPRAAALKRMTSIYLQAIAATFGWPRAPPKAAPALAGRVTPSEVTAAPSYPPAQAVRRSS